jgi:hypothetical protein
MHPLLQGGCHMHVDRGCRIQHRYTATARRKGSDAGAALGRPAPASGESPAVPPLRRSPPGGARPARRLSQLPDVWVHGGGGVRRRHRVPRRRLRAPPREQPALASRAPIVSVGAATTWSAGFRSAILRDHSATVRHHHGQIPGRGVPPLRQEGATTAAESPPRALATAKPCRCAAAWARAMIRARLSTTRSGPCRLPYAHRPPATRATV